MAHRFARVVVEIAKLSEYCLSETHPRGRHKARVFRYRLGLTSADAELLRATLLRAATTRQDEFQIGTADEFGTRFVLDLSVVTITGEAPVRSAWIVLVGEDVLRFVTCYVL
jgi:hypothetical protein